MDGNLKTAIEEALAVDAAEKIEKAERQETRKVFAKFPPAVES